MGKSGLYISLNWKNIENQNLMDYQKVNRF